MTNLRKFAAVAAASAALGAVALAATPALAQDVQSEIINGWRNVNPMTPLGPDQRGRDWGDWRYAPAYGGYGYYNPGYAPAYGYGYDDPGFASGATTVAVCPGGYSLGASGRLCWPD